MVPTLSNTNAVILARQFNAAIVNPLWLVEQGLVDRDDFRPGCVYSDNLANVVTRRFVLLIAAEQIQFTPLCPRDEEQAVAQQVLGGFVRALPHTPYTACGINVTWQTPAIPHFAEYSRGLFARFDRPPYSFFDKPNARFGTYASMDWTVGRLRLDVKPVKRKEDGQPSELLQLAFNVNVELKDKDIESIHQLLSQWSSLLEFTSDIADALTGEME